MGPIGFLSIWGQPEEGVTLRGLVFLVLFSISLACGGVVGEGNKVNVLALSKINTVQTLSNWFASEPSIEYSIVPTREYGEETRADMERYMRIYFPRSYGDLSAFDFYYLAQTDMTLLRPGQQQWIYDGLTDGLKGAVNTRSVMSTHSWFNIPWAESIVSDAFPNDADAVVADESTQEGAPGPLVIRDDEGLPAILSPYKEPLEEVFRNLGGLNTIPKPGSVILSYTENDQGMGSPVPGQIAHVFYWRWNQSTTFTFRDMVYDPFWSAPTTGSAISNPYSLDIIANIIWFSTGRELPQDPLKVHDLRRDLFDYGIKKSLLTSLLDFAEIFGANPTSEYAAMDEVEDIRREAAQSYLDRDFETAYDLMKEALSELTKLEDSATKLKDRALLWVYVVEWSVTTGVLLVAGVILWTLMIKRALYREVKATKWTR